MQVSVETVSSIERRMTVGVPAERVEGEVQKRLQKAAKTVRIDGFRPGKVPFKVVKQRYGAGVRQEVVGEVMRDSFVEAVKQENLTPAGYPNIEPKSTESGKDLEFVATFEVYPEIELGELSQLEVTKYSASIEQSDVDNMVEQLRTQQASMEEVARAAENNDQAIIDFKGTVDGEEFPGGTAEASPVILGSGSMIPGFEEGIVGMKAGEEKTLQLKFPEEYHAKELAGKAVEFNVKLQKVNESVLPELNEDFFAKFGVKEGGVEQFREEVTHNMERELNKATRNKVKTEVIDALLSTHDVQVPSALVNDEIGRLRQQMMTQFGGGQNMDPSILPAELFKDEAEKRVATGLLINKYIEANNVTPDEDKIKELVADMAASYEDPDEVVKYVYGDQQQFAHFKSLALEDQVIDGLLETIKVNEITCSYEEAIAPPAPKQKSASSEEKTAD